MVRKEQKLVTHDAEGGTRNEGKPWKVLSAMPTVKIREFFSIRTRFIRIQNGEGSSLEIKYFIMSMSWVTTLVCT